jgi:Flp pilus assembly protein TadG
MRARRLRGEAGAAAETVVIFPAFMLLILLIIQYALWLHASHALHAAAEEGARVARLAAANAPAQEVQGENTARKYVTALASNVVTSPQVSGWRTADRAHIDVTGNGTSVIPGFNFSIHKSSEGPVERFRPRTDP